MRLIRGIAAMAALIDESGGVMGRQLTIEARDDESTPAVGVSRANELISAGVPMIIEGWNSPAALAMQPVIARAGVLDLTAIARSGAMHCQPFARPARAHGMSL